MNTRWITANALALVALLPACGDDNPKATTRPQAGGSTSPTSAPLRWYQEQIAPQPAQGLRRDTILAAFKKEPVVVLATVTNISDKEVTNAAAETVKFGLATLRVDEVWKRKSDQPDLISAGLEFSFSTIQATSVRNAQRFSGNGLLLGTGDRVLVIGRYVVDEPLPGLAPAGLIIATSDARAEMLVRGDIGIALSDGVTVPLSELRSAAAG